MNLRHGNDMSLYVINTKNISDNLKKLNEDYKNKIGDLGLQFFLSKDAF